SRRSCTSVTLGARPALRAVLGGGAVSQPDDPVGAHARGGDVLVTPHGAKRLALGLALDGDEHETGTGDARERKCHAPVRVVAERILVEAHAPAGVGLS